MAIVTEDLQNGLIKTYSDAGFKIHGGIPEADYDEAIDQKSLNRQYTETDILTTEAQKIAKEADYIKALQELGVEVNV